MKNEKLKSFGPQSFRFRLQKGLTHPNFAKQNSDGFIALITILIILGAVLLISLGISQRSFGEIQMSLQKSQSSQAFYLANLCAEDALMKLKEDSNYLGNETITIGEESCQILPIEGQWTVKVSANFQNQIRKIKIVISQVNPKMIIGSWQEVPDF